MAYHYLESGLDNVFLENGYTFHETPYGKGVSIVDSDGLHKAIGRWLITISKPLVGAEIKFLRVHMEMTQKNLAAMLGTTEQTLRLWERSKKKDVPGPADRLLRALFNEYCHGDGSVRRMVERLADLDQVNHPQALFSKPVNGWKLEPSVVGGR